MHRTGAVLVIRGEQGEFAMDKDARIARLQARLVAINYERAALDAEIAALTSQEQMEAVRLEA